MSTRYLREKHVAGYHRGSGEDVQRKQRMASDTRTREYRMILLLGIFVVSFSLIAFSITLARLLSVLLSHHYVFAVLALSLLGLGGGGIFLHLLRGVWERRQQTTRDIPCWSTFFALAMAITLILSLYVGEKFQALDNIFFYGALFLVPFFFAGILLARVYREYSSESARIYGFDLVGAAAGSFGCLFFLEQMGVVSTVFFLGVLSAVAALLLAGMQPPCKKKWIIPGFGFITLLLLFGTERIGFYQPSIPIGKNPVKEIHDVLYGPSIRGRIVETRWSAFGRTDLVQLLDYPDQMDIYLDGTAGSPMYRFSGNAANPGPAIEGLQTTFPGYFPFLSLREGEKDEALIIGPGGGRDILLALMGGVKRITAVEVNKDLVDIVRRYSQFNGGIYKDRENVQVVVEEGRHFLKRSKKEYDLIMLSLPVTNTSRSLEGFALTENFLFTTEAISDYWFHLKAKGSLLVVAHDDREALRLLSLALAFFRSKGVDEKQAMRHLYIVGSEDYLVFVLRKYPLEPPEAMILYRMMSSLGYNPHISFLPGGDMTLNPILVALERGEKTAADLRVMVKKIGYDIDPVSDDNPFFYKFEKGLPVSVSLVLWISIGLLFFIAGIPFVLKKRPLQSPFGTRQKSQRVLFKTVLLFILLGVGFMLIEIAMIQQFSLFLGSPVLSMAVLLTALLAGAGTGSLWCKRRHIDARQMSVLISRSSLGVAVILFGYTFLFPVMIHQLLSLPFVFRLGITVAMLLPLGFCMGIPFPSGLRFLREIRMENLIPWVWGLNGLGSVVGSTLTIAVAIRFGFTEAIMVGVFLYLTVFVIFYKPFEEVSRLRQ